MPIQFSETYEFPTAEAAQLFATMGTVISKLSETISEHLDLTGAVAKTRDLTEDAAARIELEEFLTHHWEVQFESNKPLAEFLYNKLSAPEHTVHVSSDDAGDIYLIGLLLHHMLLKYPIDVVYVLRYIEVPVVKELFPFKAGAYAVTQMGVRSITLDDWADDVAANRLNIQENIPDLLVVLHRGLDRISVFSDHPDRLGSVTVVKKPSLRQRNLTIELTEVQHAPGSCADWVHSQMNEHELRKIKSQFGEVGDDD